MNHERRIFDYRKITDVPTKVGAIACDVLFVLLMIFMLWGVIWPAVRAFIRVLSSQRPNKRTPRIRLRNRALVNEEHKPDEKRGRSGDCGGPRLLSGYAARREREKRQPFRSPRLICSTPGAAHSLCDLVTMTSLHSTIRHYLLHSFFPISCLAALMWVA